MRCTKRVRTLENSVGITVRRRRRLPIAIERAPRAYTRSLYIGLPRNAHQLFLVIINGVKNPSKNLPSLRQVYTMEQLLLSITESILCLSFLPLRTYISFPFLHFSFSLFFPLSIELTVGVVVVVVAVAVCRIGYFLPLAVIPLSFLLSLSLSSSSTTRESQPFTLPLLPSLCFFIILRVISSLKPRIRL